MSTATTEPAHAANGRAATAEPGPPPRVGYREVPEHLQRVEARIHAARTDHENGTVTLRLEDGRSLVVPVFWSSRLPHASAAELDNFEVYGGGHSIYWPDLDEGMEIDKLLLGRRYVEGGASLKKWLAERDAR